jgi:hypothetical protein
MALREVPPESKVRLEKRGRGVWVEESSFVLKETTMATHVLTMHVTEHTMSRLGLPFR